MPKQARALIKIALAQEQVAEIEMGFDEGRIGGRRQGQMPLRRFRISRRPQPRAELGVQPGVAGIFFKRLLDPADGVFGSAVPFLVHSLISRPFAASRRGRWYDTPSNPPERARGRAMKRKKPPSHFIAVDHGAANALGSE
ncbi:MAG: hypothetical protein V3V55_09460 [Rhodospirillales bacterium]